MWIGYLVYFAELLTDGGSLIVCDAPRGQHIAVQLQVDRTSFSVIQELQVHESQQIY